MPVAIIAAPADSGVTQQDLNAALAQLITSRVLEIVRDSHNSAARLVGLSAVVLASEDLSDVTVSRMLRELDEVSAALARNRLALQYRVDALRAATHDAQRTDASVLLSQSA